MSGQRRYAEVSNRADHVTLRRGRCAFYFFKDESPPFMMRRLQEIRIPAPQFAVALRESLTQGYGRDDLRADALAGLTVGIVAIPLAMALAIASGVPPQYGLYTCIVAGLVIALSGGSRVNVSGPTAAFVVILLPITHAYGVGGLVVASLMAGFILLAMGWLRLGGLVQFIPHR